MLVGVRPRADQLKAIDTWVALPEAIRGILELGLKKRK